MNKVEHLSMIQRLIASAIASGVAEFITTPICTLKTNYQNTESNSILKTFREVYARDGIKAFYRASTFAVGGQIASSSSKYVMYKTITDLQIPYSNKMTNGMMAGIISTILTQPLDSLKIHKQMGKPIGPEIRKHGLFLLYRGYSKSFGKILISSSMFFPIYETIKEQNYHPLVAAGLSAIISTTIMQPLDYLKTRQIYGQSLYGGLDLKTEPSPSSSGLILKARAHSKDLSLNLCRVVLHFVLNPRSYFKGLSLNLLRVVPHFAIMMTLIETISTYLA